MKKVAFEYKDITGCCKKEFNDQCCCNCASQLEVVKHCCLFPKEEGCVCNDSLGFYVCVIFHDMENSQRANLSGQHGMCECWTKRKK